MTQESNGGPAFPVTFPHAPADVTIGMWLRDYFAAAALTGLLAEHAHKQSAGSWGHVDEVTQKAYEFADSMLRKRL
jgi:hypothetical protein